MVVFSAGMEIEFGDGDPKKELMACHPPAGLSLSLWYFSLDRRQVWRKETDLWVISIDTVSQKGKQAVTARQMTWKAPGTKTEENSRKSYLMWNHNTAMYQVNITLVYVIPQWENELRCKLPHLFTFTKLITHHKVIMQVVINSIFGLFIPHCFSFYKKAAFQKKIIWFKETRILYIMKVKTY